jgi:hypothetical protein
MSAQAHELAGRFDRAAAEFEAALSRLSDENWTAYVPEEQRTVAALVNHVALAWRGESISFQRIALGKSGKGLTNQELDELNAEHGNQFADADRDETMARLRKAKESTASFIRGLSDEQLERRGKHMPEEPQRSVAEWIEICLIGHPGDHLPAILAAVQTKN